MSKQQTAFQQFMVKLKESHPELFNEYTQQGREFINTFYPYLELEKEQIKSAYTKGREDWVKYEIENQDNENAIVPTPNKFYTETYGNK